MASQAAGGGPSQAAGSNQFVKFSRPAAQRIANAVRAVEAGSRGQPGLVFDHPQPPLAVKVFRVCTFTGSWEINTQKVVTFKYQANTPNTVSARNEVLSVGDYGRAAMCEIARDGTAWYLVQVEHTHRDVITGVSFNTASKQLEFERIRQYMPMPYTLATTAVVAVPIDVVTSATVTDDAVRLDRVRMYGLYSEATTTVSLLTVAVDVVTSATITSDAVRLDRVRLFSLQTQTASAVSLSVTTCATTG